jgi:hypothetical protein
LADSLRIENVALVRLAVRRIANEFNTKGDWITAGTTGWRFTGKPFEYDEIEEYVKNLLPKESNTKNA